MRYEILAPVPFFGFLVTYVVNSFLFCPGCSHHHENAELCGCFPRSVFSHKRYKSWRKIENILGWPLIIIVSVCPTLAVLHLQENSGAIVFFLAYFAVGLVVMLLFLVRGAAREGSVI